MRNVGDKAKITSGKYAGQTGTVEANVYQRIVDFPNEFNNGFHVMLDTEKLAGWTRWWNFSNMAK